MMLLKILGVLLLGGYPFPRFEPTDRIVDVLCPDESVCYFYEGVLDSLPFDSLTRTGPFGYFNEPEWLTGGIRDEFGQFYLLCVGAVQVQGMGYRRPLIEGEDPGRTLYRLEVLADDVSGRTLWITHDRSKLRVMTWPEFLCQCFLVWDPAANPPRAMPDESAAVYPTDPGPADVDGIGWHEEWLLIRPPMESPEAAGFEYAWIRWTKDDSLLVDYYLMY
jgi:hypothetical protein